MASLCSPPLSRVFEQAYPLARRAAASRGHAVAARLGDAAVSPEDIVQEVLLAVWIALRFFDDRKSSLRTFVEYIAAASVVTVIRRASTKGRRRPAQAVDEGPEPSYDEPFDLCLDIRSLLLDLSTADSKIACLLMHNHVADAARRLGVSRPALYRGVTRIRAAFCSAGYLN